MLVISDTHIGASRMAGATPASQQALRGYLREGLRDILHAHKGEHVVCNGDFFDSFQVETSELIKAYELLVEHMQTGALTMIMGNHDASAKADKISSFHLLCHFLKEAAAANSSYFRMIDHTDGFCRVEDNVYAISHCMNQDLFNLELSKAAEYKNDGSYLLLHCNVKNGHAESSDHSLNLNDEQVGSLMRAGWRCVIGHEHIGYTLRSERVIVVGNQTPSSCIDCIGDKEKNALLIRNGKHEFWETWRAEGTYVEVNWTDLPIDTPAQFIRVTGDASAAQAADVVSAIAKFRQTSNAFVVSNAVKVEGQELVSELAMDSIEEIKKFDVLGCILDKLEPREAETVKELLG